MAIKKSAASLSSKNNGTGERIHDQRSGASIRIKYEGTGKKIEKQISVKNMEE